VPLLTAKRNGVIASTVDRFPSALQIQNGVAYSAHALPDGTRAIIDIVLPTDIVGVENVVLSHSNLEVVAACSLGYRLMPARTLLQLMAEPPIAAKVIALMAEARWRVDRHLAAVIRMDARGRIAALLLGVYDRLRRANVIGRPAFNLHLTLDQIGDHLGITPVHVSRTLRQMREERLAILDRGVVLICDVDRLRAIATGLPHAVDGEESGGQQVVTQV
jgi:CRP-like cAMP-binding protein